MGVVLIEGFDTYAGTGTGTGLQAKWTKFDNGISMQAGRFAGQCAQVFHDTNYSGGSYIQRPLPSNYGSASVCFGFRRPTPVINPTNMFLQLLDSAGGFQIGLRVTAGGAIEALRQSGATAGTVLGTTSAGLILNDTWHYIELSTTIHGSTGVLNLKVDGAAVLSLSGQNTANTANLNVGHIRFGPSGTTGVQTTYRYDDLYVVDSVTPLGERRIETLYPTSDVAQGFARSTGSTNYTLVDEAQVNGDTDYVQGSTVGTVDTYGFSDLSSTPTTIDAVQLSAFAIKTDAGTRAFSLQVKSGATTSDGAAYGLNASYTKFERIIETDPNTGSAWTASGVNALQGGPKVIS